MDIIIHPLYSFYVSICVKPALCEIQPSSDLSLLFVFNHFLDGKHTLLVKMFHLILPVEKN